ncbi:MAG: hypothetical protein ACE5IP_05045 [Terriglobia bacterium]
MANSAGLALMLVALGSVPAVGDEAENTQEIALLKKKMAVQETLIQKQGALIQDLLKRLEVFEAAQARTGEKAEVASHTAASEEAGREENARTLTDIRNDLDETVGRLDYLPQVGGYFDFEYFNDDRPNSPGEFRQHHVTLFLSQEYEKVRWFSELEFEFGVLFEGEGGRDLETARGEIKVEQGWGEYVLSDQLLLRGGLILTPGYWNVYHWPNLTLSTRRPLMVRKVYPESFTGVMGHGTKYWGDFGLTYYAYGSNGDSAFSPKEDDNENKAVGGRVSFHVPTETSFETFDLGISGYTDRPSGVERTRTWGLDAQIRQGPFELLAEFATRNAVEDRTGLYIQPAYRFTRWLTAFYRYDLLDIEQGDRAREHSLGLNFKLIPQAFFKLEYFRSDRLIGGDHNGVATSFVVSY